MKYIKIKTCYDCPFMKDVGREQPDFQCSKIGKVIAGFPDIPPECPL